MNFKDYKATEFKDKIIITGGTYENIRNNFLDLERSNDTY